MARPVINGTDDVITVYIYTAFLNDGNLSIEKTPHLAYRINENKYQVYGYCDEYSIYDDTLEEWVLDLDKKENCCMIDYITADPNAQEYFYRGALKRTMWKLLKGE